MDFQKVFAILALYILMIAIGSKCCRANPVNDNDANGNHGGNQHGQHKTHPTNRDKGNLGVKHSDTPFMFNFFNNAFPPGCNTCDQERDVSKGSQEDFSTMATTSTTTSAIVTHPASTTPPSGPRLISTPAYG